MHQTEERRSLLAGLRCNSASFEDAISLVNDIRARRRTLPGPISDRSLVPESVERGRIDDPTGEVGAVSREPLDHERVVGDLRMRRDEAEGARLLEAEARVVRGDALDHDGWLACSFGAAERVPDQPCS